MIPLLTIVQENKEKLIRRCVCEYYGKKPKGKRKIEASFAIVIELFIEGIRHKNVTCLGAFLEGIVDGENQKEMHPSQGARLLNITKKVLLQLVLKKHEQKGMTKAIDWIDRTFAIATEVMMHRFEDIVSREREEIKKREHRIGELEKKIIKFTSKKSRGWVDVGGTRMCLLDIPGGWFSMGAAINLFAGEETYRRVMFEMGLAETFTQKAAESGVLEYSAKGIYDAVDTFSEAGFGDFVIEELRFAEGYARITCKDTFEGWIFRNHHKVSDVPVCYYSAGVLLSFVQTITKRNDLSSVETACIAKGDRACEFVIGTREALLKRGIRLTEWGMTIKERAEYLENLLEEKQRIENELTRKYTELTVLNNISARVNQSLDLEEILNFAINELQNIVGKDKGICIYLLDRKKNELVFTAQKGYSEEFFKRLSRLKIDEGLLGSVVKAKTPLAYDDYPNYPQALKPVVEDAKIRSAMSVPLIAKDQIVGALSIASKAPYHFTAEEINLMTLIGNHIGVAIENAQLLEEVKESERKYRTLVEDINDGYVICQGGQVVFANNAFLTMYGYKQEDVLGCDFQGFFSKEWSQPIEKMYQDWTTSKGVPRHLEFLRRHREGTKLPTELKVDFVEYDGKPAMIGIFRDISERKKMEQRMRESERLASIGQLAAAIAHEIRNPLSAIKMNIQIFSRNLKLREFDKRRLEIAAGEIKRLERIVEDVLDFARPLQMNKTSCSVHEVLRKCFDLLQDSIPHKNIQVIKKMSRVLKNVSIDNEMMEQAFLNIILNAIDAMPRGGTLEIVTRKTERAGREMVLVDFQDSGMGMNQEQLAKAFDPFYTTKTTGVGLGLSNVKKIIEAHEGIIEVESQVAQGSTFRILLPLK